MPDDEKALSDNHADESEGGKVEKNPIVKPAEPKKPVAALPEEIENHETAPAWFKPFAEQLERVEKGLKPVEPKAEAKTEPKAEVKKEEPKDGPTKEEPKRKSGKVKLWRRV